MLEIVPDIAQSTHGIRNIFADIMNVSTRPHMVLGMFLLAFSVKVAFILARLNFFGSKGLRSGFQHWRHLLRMDPADLFVAFSWTLSLISFDLVII